MARRVTDALLFSLVVAFGAAAAGPALAENALADLSDLDVEHALARVGDVADGETFPVTLGNLRARRNDDPLNDHYMYFDVRDDVLFARTPPEVFVTFHYFDRPGGILWIQYDSTTGPYKNTAAFHTTGTNVWKVHTAVLNDALFANRQNGGADFRIAAPPGYVFEVDLVYVRVPAAHMPIVRVSPAQHRDVRPEPWRDICSRWSEWSAARSRVEMLGSADHILNSVSNAELAECFANINGSHVALSVDVPVLKETQECPSGQACFDAHVGLWERFTSLGARIQSFYLDEPFFAVRNFRNELPYSDADAVNQMIIWLRLVRERYPHAQIIQVEPYPALPSGTLAWWLRALHAACAAHGLPVIDFFVLDHDWAAPGWSYSGIREVQAQSRALGIPFGVLYWASNQKTSTDDGDWLNGIMRQGRLYKRAGIVPDMYDINDFMAIPRTTVPDNDMETYTHSIRRFADAFVRRRY